MFGTQPLYYSNTKIGVTKEEEAKKNPTQQINSIPIEETVVVKKAAPSQKLHNIS